MGTFKNSTGQLSQEQLGKFRAVLHEKGATGPCPRCDHPEMQLLDSLVTAPGLATSDSAPVSDLVLLPLVCNGCGHVIFHSPYKLGLNHL